MRISPKNLVKLLDGLGPIAYTEFSQQGYTQATARGIATGRS